jgi:hypothetical protein
VTVLTAGQESIGPIGVFVGCARVYVSVQVETYVVGSAVGVSQVE